MRLDCSRIERELGWAPRRSLAVGLARTVAYYQRHRAHYWDAADVDARHRAELSAV